MADEDHFLSQLNGDVFSIIISYLDRISWCQLVTVNKIYNSILKSLIVCEPGILSSYKALKILLNYNTNQIIELLLLSKNHIIICCIYCIGLVIGKENFHRLIPLYPNIMIDINSGMSDKEFEHLLISCSKILMPYYSMWSDIIHWCVKQNRGCEIFESGPEEVKNIFLHYHAKYYGLYDDWLDTSIMYYLAKWDNWKQYLDTMNYANPDFYELKICLGAIHYNNLTALECIINRINSFDSLLEKACKKANFAAMDIIIKKMKTENIHSTINMFVFARDEIMVKKLINRGFNWVQNRSNVNQILKTNRRYPGSRLINYNKYFSKLCNWEDFLGIADTVNHNKIFSKLADMYDFGVPTPKRFWGSITSIAQIDILLNKGFILHNRFMGISKYDFDLPNFKYIFELSKDQDLMDEELKLAINFGIDAILCVLIANHESLKENDYISRCENFEIIKILYSRGFRASGGNFLKNWVYDFHTNLFAYSVLKLGIPFTVDEECLNKLVKHCPFNMIKHILLLPNMTMAVKSISALTQRADKKTFKFLTRIIGN